ncbi:MAG: hypothetical protein BRD55_06730 [Bacteroidetes bacterium SW_9_63_38]|nr:MAG: hypothetical protein BRD55_06730 [Bacteroidetes bacterium SW_9_63_38]
MKRLAVAGAFATIGGAATLLMVASILYSCRQGGHPHDMGTDAHSEDAPSHSSVMEPPVDPRPAAPSSARKVVLPHA